MGIYDRDYNRANYSGGLGAAIRYGVPPISPIVKKLLIINIAVFVAMLIPGVGEFIDKWFSVSAWSVTESLQLWRIITYQFVHAGLGHIFINMLVLYFFGPMLEHIWGGKRFLKFYLICGSMGGIVYPILVAVGFPYMSPGNLVGASGAIYGILAATAIMFPQMRVYVFGVFPIPMIVLAGIMVLVSISKMLGGANAGGEAAHLAGMAAGAAYILWGPMMQKRRTSSMKGRWEKKISDERQFQQEVDRILAKVHESGISSLTRKEKKALKAATEREQER